MSSTPQQGIGIAVLLIAGMFFAWGLVGAIDSWTEQAARVEAQCKRGRS